MKTKRIALGVALAAAALTVSACSSSSSSGSGSSSGAGNSGGKTIASKFIFGAAPEFKTRTDGLPGLQKDYGVTFGSFKPLDAGGPLTINALKNGQIDAADIFTTDPSIKNDDFLVLQDPKSLYLAQNVLPLIAKSKATAGVTKTLNAVSAKLTTAELVQLNVDVITDKKDPDAVAKQWLASNGLDTPGSSAKGVSLTVGSANFQENVTLAEVYAEALKAQGASVKTKLNIGSRETYIPGLKDGSIDLIPEYSGVLLQYFDKNASPAPTPDAVYAALQKVLPSKLTVLDQSQAQDKDGIVVTAATAKKYGLSSIADLAKTS